MSTSNRGQQSLSSGLDRRLSNDMQYDQSNHDYSSLNRSSLYSQPSDRQAVRLENRFLQLNITNNRNMASAAEGNTNHVSLLHTPCMPNEAFAEEELVERLKTLIYEFMTRPGRHYAYNTTIRWIIDHGQQIKYSVIITVKPSSDMQPS